MTDGERLGSFTPGSPADQFLNDPDGYLERVYEKLRGDAGEREPVDLRGELAALKEDLAKLGDNVRRLSDRLDNVAADLAGHRHGIRGVVLPRRGKAR